MDTEILVDDRFEDGRKLVSQLVQDGFEVTAAVWIKSNEGSWRLYLASPIATPDRIGDAYRAVYGSLSKVPASSVSLSEIKLVSPENPIARDVLEIQRRFPGRIPTRTRRPKLGDLAIEEAYIYPRVTPGLSRGEVLQAIAGFMARGKFDSPALVTLRDGSTIRAIPLSLGTPQPGKVEIEFRDVETNATRKVNADDVVNIR
jgi:hypothetical protein